MPADVAEYAQSPQLDIASRSGSLHLISSRLLALIAVGLLALGLALRLFAISHQSVWLDEGYTLLFSHLPLDRLITVGGAHEHPPFYYVLVHLGLDIRDTYLVPRLVSAVAGAAIVAALCGLGKQLYDRPTGLLAAALVAVSPAHIWSSQDGRAYELAGLLVILSYLTLFTALHRPARTRWIAYVLCTALAFYTEYTAALALIPQVLLFVRARHERTARSLIRSWLAMVALLIPWIGVFVVNAASVAREYWIPTPTLDTLVNTVLEFLGFRVPCSLQPCEGFETAYPFLAGHELPIVAGVVGAVLAVPLLAAWRRDVTLAVLGLWVLSPFAIVFAVMPWRSLYLDRVFLDTTFPLYLLLAAAITRSRQFWRALAPVAVFLAVLAASLNSLHPLYANSTNPDWRTAARDIVSAARENQSVVYAPAVVRSVIAPYLPAHWHRSRNYPLWYHAYLDVPGWKRRYQPLIQRELRRHPAESLRLVYARVDAELRDVQLRAATRGERQVWLVAQDYVARLPETRAWLRLHQFHLLLSEVYGGDTRIELWDRRLPPAFGPSVVAGIQREPGWVKAGRVAVHGGMATEAGRALIARTFPVSQGAAYTVNVEYRSFPPALPLVRLRTFGRRGNPTGVILDGSGPQVMDFPQTKWYDMPVNGVWISQPFGFVAPPGAVRATLSLRNLWGVTDWRNVAVYRER